MDSQDNPGNHSSTAESPCVDHCTIDANEMCIGCFRTLDEIARWSSMAEADKRTTNRRCDQRRNDRRREDNSGELLN